MPPNAQCLPVPRASRLFLCPSSIEPLILVSAPPVRRAVARLAELRAPSPPLSDSASPPNDRRIRGLTGVDLLWS
jgi:hypothetical protein